MKGAEESDNLGYTTLCGKYLQLLHKGAFQKCNNVDYCEFKSKLGKQLYDIRVPVNITILLWKIKNRIFNVANELHTTENLRS
jgi:hypothetical protein